MTNKTQFLLNLHFNKAFSHFSPEKKKEYIDKIIKDPQIEEILNPLQSEYYDDIDDEIEEKSFEEMTSEERILAKQLELGIDPKIKEEKKEENNIKERWGRTELHEMVLISDLIRLKELLKDKKINIFAKDNNNQDAYQLALLEGKIEAIEIMKSYYI